jgi:chromosome segregation ATPase
MFFMNFPYEDCISGRGLMIEPIMYFGIGFLVAALIGLLVVPLIHGRAVRLTMRRLEAAAPLSMLEVQADKDKLRADFAMSTRRLEMSVETLKSKSVSQLAELNTTADTMSQLKAELGEKKSTVFALEARNKTLRDQLRAAEEEIAVKTNAMYEAERAGSDKVADYANLMREFDKCSSLAETQKLEITALRAKLEAIKARDEILLYVIGTHGSHLQNGHDAEHPPVDAHISP